MSNPTIRQYLTSLGRPVITIPECARAIGINPPNSLYYRMRVGECPVELMPKHTFRAGGTEMMTLENAIEWCEKVAPHWGRLPK